MRSIPTVLIMKAERLLRHGCEAYLVFVTTDRNGKVKLSELPVVCEFPDVFPDELPGLPPQRDVEFSIDLVSGIQPISKATYRMAPNELKEFKT